jgi:hypothetical protein
VSQRRRVRDVAITMGDSAYLRELEERYDDDLHFEASCGVDVL